MEALVVPKMVVELQFIMILQKRIYFIPGQHTKKEILSNIMML